jgi:hypothetical protein
MREKSIVAGWMDTYPRETSVASGHHGAVYTEVTD